MMKLREMLKSGVVIISLAILTLIMIELPKQYYNRSDEKLLEKVEIDNYSISLVSEEMNLRQKIKALASNDSIVGEGKKTNFTEAEQNELTARLLDETEIILDDEWNELLKECITGDTTLRHWERMQIIQVIDDKIYSFDLGAMAYMDEDSDENNGVIFFDIDTGKILYMYAFSYYTDADYYYEIEVDYEVETYYEKAEEEYAVDEVNRLKQFNSTLQEYYGMDIPMDESEAFIWNDSVCISPFNYEEASSDTIFAVYEHLYSTFPPITY